MNKRQLTVIGIVLFASVVLFTVMSFRQEAQTNKPQDEKATVVHKGQVTAEEWEYTKELKKFYGNGDGQKITEHPGKGDIGIAIGAGSMPHSTNEPVITASQFLGRLSCQADAILVGTVKNKESHLSADETFVYTAYDFEVIKNNKRQLQVPGWNW